MEGGWGRAGPGRGCFAVRTQLATRALLLVGWQVSALDEQTLVSDTKERTFLSKLKAKETENLKKIVPFTPTKEEASLRAKAFDNMVSACPPVTALCCCAIRTPRVLSAFRAAQGSLAIVKARRRDAWWYHETDRQPEEGRGQPNQPSQWRQPNRSGFSEPPQPAPISEEFVVVQHAGRHARLVVASGAHV